MQKGYFYNAQVMDFLQKIREIIVFDKKLAHSCFHEIFLSKICALQNYSLKRVPKEWCGPPECELVPGTPQCFNKKETVIQEVFDISNSDLYSRYL